MEKEELRIEAATKQRLSKVASEIGLSPDELAEVLINAFIDGKGKVYAGNWKEGPGLRLLPDWPRFSSGVIKIKKEK
jgi:hypothetical protein